MEGPKFLDKKVIDTVEISEREKESLTLGKKKKDGGCLTQNIYFKGKSMGYISLRDTNLKESNLAFVYDVNIKPQYRKKQKIKGIGKEVYRKVNQELNKQRRILASELGGITSTQARHMWDSLVKSGEAEIIIDDLTAKGVPVRYKFKDPK